MAISTDAAARLIAAQFPELGAHPIERLDTAGTVNALFRVGTDLAARFPFDIAPVEELNQEAAAMAAFAAASPFPAPRPFGTGAPGEGYASAWSVQTWLPGSPADHTTWSASESLADDVAALVRALWDLPVGDRTFDGRGRGGDLRDHDEWMTECFARSGGILDADRARVLWERLRELGPADELAMSHRDLTPPNLLVSEGRLAGVLDGGSFGAADRALDLVAVWHLFDAPRRARLRRALAVDDVLWRRGAAWALQQAMGLGWYYETSNPTMSALGISTVERLLDAPELLAQ